jgi:hypothetical protein
MIRTDNGSVIIYFTAVLILKICRYYNLYPFCITNERRSQFFLSLYLTHQSSLVMKCVRNTDHRLTNVETVGAI